MTHMVIFRTPEGKPGYHQAENVEDAVRFVEHVRNHDGVLDARIFAMQEVPIEFKTWFRVEVVPSVAMPAPESMAPAAPAPEPVEPAPVEEHGPEPVAAGGFLRKR